MVENEKMTAECKIPAHVKRLRILGAEDNGSVQKIYSPDEPASGYITGKSNLEKVTANGN